MPQQTSKPFIRPIISTWSDDETRSISHHSAERAVLPPSLAAKMAVRECATSVSQDEESIVLADSYSQTLMLLPRSLPRPTMASKPCCEQASLVLWSRQPTWNKLWSIAQNIKSLICAVEVDLPYRRSASRFESHKSRIPVAGHLWHQPNHAISRLFQCRSMVIFPSSIVRFFSLCLSTDKVSCPAGV